MNGLGFFMSILIGGIAGWVAEKIMKSEMGLIRNILLGIVGAVVLNAILEAFNIVTEPTALSQGIVAVLGACLLIAIWRAIKRK